MMRNITCHCIRNSSVQIAGERTFWCSLKSQVLADRGGTDGHERQMQAHTLRQVGCWRIARSKRFSLVFARGQAKGTGLKRPVCHANRRTGEYILPPVPAAKHCLLVAANHQEKLAAGLFGLQFRQRFDGVTRADAPDFPVINDRQRQVAKGQLGHFQPVLSGRKVAGLVPGVAGRDDPEFIKLQLLYGDTRQRDMSAMGRIKGSAKYPDASGLAMVLRWGRRGRASCAQTQSLGRRKSRVKAASGEPGGSSRR